MWQGKSYYDTGTVHRVVPNKLLRYNFWSSLSGLENIPENYMYISYELNEGDGQTILTVTQENIPDENTKEHSEQNWRMVLGDLKKLLEHPRWTGAGL